MAKDIYTFLRLRDLPESLLLRMKDDKIDEETVGSIDDCKLAEYIPKLGDRVALRNFCFTPASNKKSKRALLFEVLKSKIQNSEETSTMSNPEELKEVKGIEKNSKVRKCTRKIEMGWMHQHKQVRKRNGGGTRKIDVDRSLLKVDLIKVGQQLFFPDGVSKKGLCEDFIFDILDFKETVLPETVTVADCYEAFKTGVLTYYLHTTYKTPALDSGSSVTETNMPIVPLVSGSFPETVTTDFVQELFSSVTETNMPIVPLVSGSFPETVTTDFVQEHCSSVTETNMPIVPLVSGSFPETVTTDFVQPVSGSSFGEALTSESLSEVADVQLIGDSNDIFADTLSTIQHRNRRCLSLHRSRPGTYSNVDAAKAVLKNKIKPLALEDILRVWSDVTVAGDSYEMIIHRGRIIQSTKRGVERQDFSYTNPFKVVFSGEMGDDLGGPKREYFRLLMQAVRTDVLEGNPATFKHSVAKLDKQQYKFAGQCCAWSLLHGGPGLPVLILPVFNYLMGRPVACTPSLENVTDTEVKDNILKIEGAQALSDLDDISDWMIDQGLPVVTTLTETTKQQLTELTLKNCVVYRVSAEVDQFRQGLLTVGRFFDLLQEYTEELKPILVHLSEPLTASKLKAMYIIQFSEQGSNSRVLEDDTIYAFECFIQDCQGETVECTLSEVLCFWTGADEVPPMGFDKKLEVQFVADNIKANRLPVAHTCGMVLELPRGIPTPENFSERMIKAIQWGGEFHLA